MSFARPAPAASTPTLQDGNERIVDYIRVSVTDRCNYRCKYCMPAEGVPFMDKGHLLSFEETATILRCFAGLGVKRVRLTGGEPLLRRDLEILAKLIKDIPGIDDLSMTTNGHLLTKKAETIVKAGVNRFNVSLDSIRPERFASITRGGELERVLEGIDTLVALGVEPIKINCVVMPGFNTDELVPMVAHFAKLDYPIMVRFIEYMPFRQRDFDIYSADEMEAELRSAFTLGPFEGKRGGGPATYLHVEGTKVDVGFIAPITRRFCASCNRVRLSSDGRLRTCLAFEDTPSLRDELRKGISPSEMRALIRRMVGLKPEGHGCAATEASATPFEGFMSAVGG